MNSLKIQSDALKSMIKNKEFVWSNLDDRIGIGTGHFMCFLNRDDVFLTFKQEPFNIKPLYEKLTNSDYHLADSITPVDHNGKHLLCMVHDNVKVYVNRDYTQYFNKDASYYVLNSRSPVLVMEHDEIAGFIFPVIVLESEGDG